MKEWFGEKILGLPQLASSNGRGVDDLIIYVHWLMLALFIGWTIYFLYAIRRFAARAIPRPIITASAVTPRIIWKSASPSSRRCC